MGNKIKRCGIYVRCSTGEQSTNSQLNALKEFAAARGWQVCKVYEDHAVSGTKAKRPGLDAMWADCRQHKIDLCLVFALDRMARSLKHLIEALDEFGRLGVDFVCLKQDIDNYQRSVATVIPHRRCRSGIREGANLQPGKGRHERSTS